MRQQGCVLVVDDEPYVRRALSYLLSRCGFEVETATNGEEGILRARELQPAIVFLDVSMPRMTGLDACRQIKADPATAGCHVIMLTGHGEACHVMAGRDAGANDYLTKPFSPSQVRSLVFSIAGEPAGAAA